MAKSGALAAKDSLSFKPTYSDLEYENETTDSSTTDSSCSNSTTQKTLDSDDLSKEVEILAQDYSNSTYYSSISEEISVKSTASSLAVTPKRAPTHGMKNTEKAIQENLIFPEKNKFTNANDSSVSNKQLCCALYLKKRAKLISGARKVPYHQWRCESANSNLHENIFGKVKSKSVASLTFEPNKLYKYGEKGSGFKSKGVPQDYYTIRDRCLQSGSLFEDPEFPPTDSSLYFSQRPDRHFEWKRPGELVDQPQLFVEGFSRFDVQQGELGDCWLLAAVANLTLYRRLFFQIVPDDQNFEDNYAGVFHFRFWQYGRWIDVVIDDRLPTYRGQLVFLHSTEENEFWSALLEKAYAKLHGSYEALKGGSTCEAMEDFTGGVTEMYEMDAAPPNLFKIIMKAYERWSLMGCSIEPDPNVLEAQTHEGLIRGHAYSITKVQYVEIQTPNVSGKIPLLRLRNPWGNDSEWNGPWSDHAPEWQYISDDVKEELGLNFDGDGEFWMSFKDFQRYFNRLEICNLNPDSLSEDELTEGRDKKWSMSVFEGEWVRGVTAGGCRNFLDTFPHNPQYNVTLTEVDEGEDEQNCTLIVALMQKNRRQIRSTGGDLLTIGFAIYHLPYPDRVPKPLDISFFKFNASVARSPSFINLREVSCRFKLPPGTYCIVPSTFDPNEEGEFILRVFSENQNTMEYEGSYRHQIRDVDDNEVGDDDDNRYRQPRSSHFDDPSPYAPPAPSSPYSPPYPSHPAPFPPSDPYNSSGYGGGGGYPPNPGYPQSGYGQYPFPGQQPSYPPNPGYQGYPQPNSGYPGYPGQGGDGGGGSRSPRERDQDIGLTPVDDKVKPKPTKEAEARKQKAYLLFKETAGADNEIDWIELKHILDNFAKIEKLQKVVQYDTQTQLEDNNGLISSFWSMYCLPYCKDSQIRDVVQPLIQNADQSLQKKYFDNHNSLGFSKDCCRSIIAMLDCDHSGRLNFEEFEKFWTLMQILKNVFQTYDKDNTGTLSGFELRNALSSAGYNLNNHTLNVLMHRYGNKMQEIDFDDFIQCTTKLKTMIDLFEASSGKLDTATFTKENWINATLYS